jgi:hypothetical protein
VRLHGEDALTFLHGLLTNDTRPLAAAVHGVAVSPLYSALLSPQGRFLFDGFFFSQTTPGAIAFAAATREHAQEPPESTPSSHTRRPHALSHCVAWICIGMLLKLVVVGRCVGSAAEYLGLRSCMVGGLNSS